MPANQNSIVNFYSVQSNKNAKCSRCSSDRTEFCGELAIHFAGLAGLDKPIVWVFPRLSVCLDCGLAEFIVPEKELEVLRTGTPVEGAAVWLGGVMG